MPRLSSVVLLALAALTSPMAAQDVAPPAGTWGAEASPDNRVTLLRFRSTTSAWLVGLEAFHFRRDESAGEDVSSSSVMLHLGMRGYRNPAERVRPFSGFSALMGYQDDDFDGGAIVLGASGELGAAYFFSRHISLGSALELSATYFQSETTEFPSSSLVDVRTYFVRAAIRFMGAVYF